MPALDPATLSQRQGIGIEDIPAAHSPPVERHADERPDEREDEREVDHKHEDREDDTDAAIRLARGHAIESVQYLSGVLVDLAASREDRIKAATILLEVAGCL